MKVWLFPLESVFLLVLLSGGLWLLGLVPLWTAALLAIIGGFIWSALSGRSLLITREGAWGQEVRGGFVIRSYPLGMNPDVYNLGWCWDEVALFPKDPGLRARLHDQERFVLLEEEDPELIERIRREFCRLHGGAPDQ